MNSLPEPICVSDFSSVDFTGMYLPMLVVYERPRDYPEHIVTRIFDMDKPTGYIHLAKTVEEAKNAVPRGWIRLEPDPNDDPNIIGVYL